MLALTLKARSSGLDLQALLGATARHLCAGEATALFPSQEERRRRQARPAKPWAWVRAPGPRLAPARASGERRAGNAARTLIEFGLAS